MKNNQSGGTKTRHAVRGETALGAATWGAALLTCGFLLAIIIFILAKGLPHLKPSLFALEYNSENVSLFPALVSTVIITLLSLLIAAPAGLFAAIWLVEYAQNMTKTKAGGALASIIRMTAETLAGIPSIVYGLFGLLFFVTRLGWGFSVLAGSCTLSMMILPLILRSTEEALKAVPVIWREGAFALGAGKLRTVFRIILPAALPGILAGVILAAGRVIGETAALIYTAGTVARVPLSPLQSARTLSVHMYALSGEGLHTGEAYATAAVLLIVVIGINTAAASLARLLGKR